MAVPKRKHSKSRRDMNRNAHWKLSLPGIGTCPNCGAIKLSHRACKKCGTYNGREVISVSKDAE